MGDVQIEEKDKPIDYTPKSMSFTDIPKTILSEDVDSQLLSDFFQDLARIDGLYAEYYTGVDFLVEGSHADYIPSDLKYKKIKRLIDEEARFMFANPPDIRINPNGKVATESEKEDIAILNTYIKTVLNKKSFNSKLIKAAKDCFIAGRVCLVVNFNENGIDIDFLNAKEFYYEFDGDKLTKLIAFYHLNNSKSKTTQRIKKKIYELENDVCVVTESLYDGTGNLLEEDEKIVTKFDFIPCYVIFNDGLSGDTIGESDADAVDDYEQKYSKISNSDIDALRKSMNGIKWTIDASAKSTENLSTGPGAYWDLSSDETLEGRTAQVGILEPQMAYSDALKNTLERMDNAMYGQLSIPNISSEQLQGMITSGKTIKALYWPLIVRSDEKAHIWKAALEFMVETILTGSKIESYIVSIYSDELNSLPDVSYKIVVENAYPLPEDEQEEKQTDLLEIQSQVMSRKSYMKKWYGLTDEEADEELNQILLEKQLFEESMFDTNAFGAANPYVMGADQRSQDTESDTLDEESEEDMAEEENDDTEQTEGEEQYIKE
jgi:hypothetical protein